jgi:outer membrane protein assembly factor BamB
VRQIVLNRFIVLLLWFSATGCAVLDEGKDFFTSMMGGEDNSHPPAALIEYEPELEIEKLWEEQVGSGSEAYHLKLGLAISYGKIFAGAREGLVQARDLQSGDIVWEQESEWLFSAGPGVGEDTVILGTSHGQVTAFAIDTGEPRWHTAVSSEVLATPVVARGIVIIRTIDGKVYALNEKDGKQLWLFERDVPPLSIRGLSRPVIVEGNAIVGFANGKLLALRLADGKLMWESTIAIPAGRSEVDRLVDLDADPVESDGVVFVSSFQAGTFGVLEVDGDVLWNNPAVASKSGMSADWRYLYLTDKISQVWQLDQRNGASLWKQDELQYRNLSAPVVYDDYVVVGDFEGYLHWLSSSDGRQMARVRLTGDAIDAQPLVIEKTVYVYARDGSLAAFRVRTK